MEQSLAERWQSARDTAKPEQVMTQKRRQASDLKPGLQDCLPKEYQRPDSHGLKLQSWRAGLDTWQNRRARFGNVQALRRQL